MKLTKVRVNPNFWIHTEEQRKAFKQGTDAQLDDDQEKIDELQFWYDKLLEDYKSVKRSRAKAQEKVEVEGLIEEIENLADTFQQKAGIGIQIGADEWQALKQRLGVKK